MGQGLSAAVLGTVPTMDTHAVLCCLTPTALRIAQRGESSSGPCSLRISVQDQLLPPRPGSLLQGLGNLGIRAYRAPYDGSASAPTEPRLFTQSMHSNQHIARQALRPAITGAPTSHKIGCDQHVAPALQGQDHSINHAATVIGYRARTCRLCSHDAV